MVRIKVVGKGQVLVEKNNFPVATVFEGETKDVPLNVGDTLGLVTVAYAGYQLLSLCDDPRTECKTDTSYYFDITGPTNYTLIATFASYKNSLVISHASYNLGDTVSIKSCAEDGYIYVLDPSGNETFKADIPKNACRTDTYIVRSFHPKGKYTVRVANYSNVTILELDYYVDPTTTATPTTPVSPPVTGTTTTVPTVPTTPTVTPAPGCTTLVAGNLALLQKYDVNRNGKIDAEEGVQATLDFYDGKITRDQATAIVNAKLWACTFTPSTAPPIVAPVATIPKIFNVCWKVGLAKTGSCAIPPDTPAVKAGDSVTIKADIANTGPAGKVRAVFKADGVQISSQDNTSLGTYPTGGLWSPNVDYTMPNKNIVLVVEAYGFDSSTSVWTKTDTKTLTISMTVPSCTGVDLLPYSASLNPSDTANNKVTLTATVTPTSISFPVTFKDGTGLVLGTCNTTVGTGKCTYVFDSTKPGTNTPGTHTVTAITGACYSTSAVIQVSVPISQWTLAMNVKDEDTGAAVSGATVLVATAGKPSQTRSTDTSGNVSFVVDQGTVSITISKSGYNTTTDAQYVFNNKSLSYLLVPTPPPPPPGGVPVPGSIQFVSVPVGARIFIDNTDTSQVTPVTISNITSGTHNFTLKLSGYNDLSGTALVQSGSTTPVYVTMTVVTPTTGSINITSHPVMGAKIYIDNRDTGLTTSASTRITEIPPGTHLYKLVLSGYRDATGNFGINAGQTAFLDVELVPLPTIGTAEISSTPSGARVFVDNVDTQKVTPASISNLSEGSHSFKLTLSGYNDFPGNFIIGAGQVTPVSTILVLKPPTTGTLEISSEPPNARVYVDGLDTQRITPATVPNLTEGTHTYKLILSGYKDSSAIVSITAGQTKTVSAILEQIAVAPPREGAELATIAIAAVAGVALLASMGKKESEK